MTITHCDRCSKPVDMSDESVELVTYQKVDGVLDRSDKEFCNYLCL